MYFVLAQSLYLIGQNKNDDNDKSIPLKDNFDKSYFEVDLNFMSDAVFMGRKDSIAAPYLYPSIVYHHRSGFYLKGSFSFLTQADESRIDLYLLTAGFDFLSKKLYGDISATKYFFNAESYNVISAVEADITANLIYDLDIFNFSVSASTYINNNSGSDFFLLSGISHDFMTSDNKFQISPNVEIQFGSQNFYEEYYLNNRFGNRQGSGTGGNGSMQTIVSTSLNLQESEKFNLMAIEFSLPMWYMHNSLTFSFIPTLALPQNEAKILVDDNLIKENLKETFYWLLGVSYKFD